MSWPSWPSGIGVATGVQLVPFHLAAMESKEPTVLRLPTTQALLADSVLTPSRMPDPLGPGTVVQLVPFQRWISAADEAPLVKPTAQALLAELASTSRSSLSTAGLGLDTMLQLVPFHRWISGRRNGLLTSSARPTAHALEDEVASTPKSTLSNWVRFGLATRPGRRRGGRPEQQQWRPAAPPTRLAGACGAAAQDSLLTA